MNKTIGTLQDALSYQLQGMMYAEDKVKDEFRRCSHHITSAEVRKVIEEYIDNAVNVKLRLDRVFNYLMVEPVSRKNDVITKMVEETQFLLTGTSSAHLKDIMMIACIKNINAYKTAIYQTSYLIAVELQMDTPADLIQQILEAEVSTGKGLAGLSIREFNNINDLTFAN